MIYFYFMIYYWTPALVLVSVSANAIAFFFVPKVYIYIEQPSAVCLSQTLYSNAFS